MNEHIPPTPDTDPAFHYPPDLLNLLVEAIPRLSRSKLDVLVFFRGAGVPLWATSDLASKVRQDRDSITKFGIVRTVLTRLNAKGDAALRERREILRRVTQWEDFSTCWEADRMEAMGLVAQIRHVVNVHDSFTRMTLEREADRQAHLQEHRARQAQLQERRSRLQEVQRNLSALFAEPDAHRRGKALEQVLNDLFRHSEILI